MKQLTDLIWSDESSKGKDTNPETSMILINCVEISSCCGTDPVTALTIQWCGF